MKKSLLLLSLMMLVGIASKAQNPEAIYLATWVTMSDLGTAVTPDAGDPKLTYNASTGCYEGEVIDWPKISINPYNAKIPYSVDGDEVTYYGVANQATQQLIFNTNPINSFSITSSTNPKLFKGFGLSPANNNSVESIKVSLNLSSHQISFSQFESEESTKLPELVSVMPENGSAVTPDEDGSITVTLTFSGEVTSMMVSSEDADLHATSSEGGTVWTIVVPAAAIQASAAENQGKLVLKIEKVYAGNLPVGFGSNTALGLSYTVEGVTSGALVKFTGSQEALQSVKAYKFPYYTAGDEVELTDYSFEVTYKSSATYLFTVGSSYNIEISSTVASDNNANWSLGTGIVSGVNDAGESTGQTVARGTTLTIYPGANGAVFTVSVIEKESGIHGITDVETGSLRIFDINGRPVDKNKLTKGIYIINGKKVIL